MQQWKKSDIAYELYPDTYRLERTIYNALHNANCLAGKHSYKETIISNTPYHVKYECENCDHSFELRPELTNRIYLRRYYQLHEYE